MKVDLISTKKFVLMNKLQEVDNPVTFEKGGIPSTNGLLSTELFGTSVSDRKDTYGTIDLHGPFFTPFIYKVMKRLDRRIESIIAGTKTFVISDKGEIVEDEKGDTGLNWLYKNWDKIKFKRNESTIRSERIDVIEAYDKDTIFTKFWVVIPAFYRDVNLQNADGGKLAHHEINDLYSRLIRLTKSVADNNQFDFMFSRTSMMIQETLVDIYDLLKGMLEKKNGLIRKSLLGKSIDYGARSVISAPIYNTNTAEDMDVDFYKTGIPLSQTCSTFTVPVIAWVRRFFERELESMGMKYPVRDSNTGEITYVKLKEPALHFNEDYITKMLDRFVHSPGDRFEKVVLPVDDPNFKKTVYLSFAGRNYDGKNDDTASPLIKRPATWTDIFFQAAVASSEDRMVWITRYPLLDYFGMLTTHVSVRSTLKTTPMVIGNKVYSNYPVVDLDLPKGDVGTYFVDTIVMSNLYLTGLGGDYDGDQVSVRGVYSQEAVTEAKEIMNSKAYILNVYGENIRKTTNEAIQTLYMMTKFED